MLTRDQAAFSHPARVPPSAVRLAFLGCGAATEMHTKTLRRFGKDVCRFYASRHAERAADFDRRLGGHGHFRSYEAAIESDRVRVVLVATPPATHLELTLQALRAGKDVIVEKPPFLRAADFDAVEQAQAETGRRVLVAENYYYKPIAARLRAIIAGGLLGDVRFVDVKALKQQRTGDWRDDAALAGGGALFEGGIHWVNFMANLGLEPRRVHGFRPGAGQGLDRSMLVVMEYAEGAVGTLAFSWETPSPLRGLRMSRIFGSEGSAAFESNGLSLLLMGRRRRLSLPSLTDLPGYRAMFRDFFDALRTGREPEFTLAKARRDLELLEAIYQSAETHHRARRRRHTGRRAADAHPTHGGEHHP